MPASERPPKQKLWLIAKYEIFKEHHDRKTLGIFFPPLFEEYFALWPPTGMVQGEEGDTAIADPNIRKLEEKRIYRWMHNRDRSKHGTNGQGSAASLNLTAGPPKKKAPVQMYVRRYWETKVKPEVIKLWAPTPETDLFGEIDNGEDQVAWEAMTPMERNIPLWFKMQVGRQLYEAESDEVKAEIDRLRDQEKEDALSVQASTITFTTEKERVHAMQHFDGNFPKLSNALTHLCDNMLRDFGFQTTIIVGGPVVREGGRLGSFTFESSGTTHKQLTFSEFCGASYATDISDKFTEYLKLCYPKEKRRYYTLGPVQNATTASSESTSTLIVPPRSPHPPAVEVSHPSPTIGPDRTKQVSKQARLRTGPLSLHRKQMVLANIANTRTSRVTAAEIDGSVVETPPVVTPEMDVSQTQTNVLTINASGPIEHSRSSTVDCLSDAITSVPDDCAPDSGSYTSTLPDVFGLDMDDPNPLATGPWVAINHFTGQTIVSDDDLVIPTPAAPQTEIEIGILPRLGVHTIIETEPPTLLFEDEEVRPVWLISAVKEFLRYTPYYGRLAKAVDLFLAQEARLGYPNLSVRQALPSRNRPTEVAQFLKWARKYSRGDDVDTRKFGATVLTWWLTIQPTTRKQWPPTYDTPPNDFSFDYFNRGGPNGVFLMILCLGWWANTLTADMDLTDYTLVVNDVCWVLEQIANRA